MLEPRTINTALTWSSAPATSEHRFGYSVPMKFRKLRRPFHRIQIARLWVEARQVDHTRLNDLGGKEVLKKRWISRARHPLIVLPRELTGRIIGTKLGPPRPSNWKQQTELAAEIFCKPCRGDFQILFLSLLLSFTDLCNPTVLKYGENNEDDRNTTKDQEGRTGHAPA